MRAHEANAGSGHQRAGSNSDSNAATHRASAASQTGLRYSISVALVDVATDREVWMLYSSFLRALGPGLIWAYGPQAQAIAVGTTGGGPDIPGSPQMPVLSCEELAHDLRLARHYCDQILIHSLEGCVWQGFLPRLRSLAWANDARPPQWSASRLAGVDHDGTVKKAWQSQAAGRRSSLSAGSAGLFSFPPDNAA